MTIHLCPHCGADVSRHPFRGPESGGGVCCPDCGLGSDDGPVWEPPFEPHQEVWYRLDAWSPGDRLALALALHDVPFRWEPGPVLVVREEDEAAVEAALDHLEERGDPPRPETATDGEDDGADEAGAILSELFVIADRLIHRPWDLALLARMEELAVFVAKSDPGFGMEATVWADTGQRAGSVVTAGDHDDEDGVRNAARALRGLLREYV